MPNCGAARAVTRPVTLAARELVRRQVDGRGVIREVLHAHLPERQCELLGRLVPGRAGAGHRRDEDVRQLEPQVVLLALARLPHADAHSREVLAGRARLEQRRRALVDDLEDLELAGLDLRGGATAQRRLPQLDVALVSLLGALTVDPRDREEDRVAPSAEGEERQRRRRGLRPLNAGGSLGPAGSDGSGGALRSLLVPRDLRLVRQTRVLVVRMPGRREAGV